MKVPFISWLFPAIMLEVAVLLFMWFRRILRRRLFLLVPALLGFFTLLMFVMVIAEYLSAGPMQFAAADQRFLIACFVVLAILILTIPHIKLGYKANAAGDRARERDLRNPPRKRPLLVDLIGFFSFGIVLLLVLGVVIAAGSGYGH